MMSGREALHAGATPKMSAAANAAIAVNASTVPSIETAVARGSAAGASWINASMPDCAIHRPTAPPSAASTRLSATSCRTRRHRLPPIAARTASSRSRAEARTSSRLATLAHAIRRTNPTAPINAASWGRTSATRSSCIGSSRRFMLDVCLIGKRWRRSADRRSSSACAWSKVTPVLSFAIPRMKTLFRDPVSKFTRLATRMSGCGSTLVPGGNSNSNPGASTPTTSARPLPNSMVLPTMDGSPP